MASTHTPFPAKVVTPEGVLFDGQVRELQVTSVTGGLGILARRSPVVADLKLGQVRAELEDGTWVTWATEEGFAQASESTATVVVEEAIAVDRIDAATAAEIVSEARAQLDAAGDDEVAATAARRQIAWGEHLASLTLR
ncbi:MAG: synthase epsilon chain [Thermoleophilia bacterium]|nr:synthase epsilon chain [Thermoleophilia bacterium]